MKPFTCEICSKSFSHKNSKKRHIITIYHGKHRDVNHNEKIGNQTMRDENKHIESMLNSVKTDFERKRELGKRAMEMIDKYELNVKEMPEDIKNAIIFYLNMEGKD